MPAQHPSLESLRHGELNLWRMRHAGAELLIARQGAQILGYRRGDAPPLIWLSEEAAYQPGQGVRGGVPLCWPWFGDLARNPQPVRAMVAGEAPFHGLARTLDWQLEGIEERDGELRLSLSLDTFSGLPGWPHAVVPRLVLSLGEALTIELHNHNRGDSPAAISQALHSYFAVGDIRQARVRGLDGCRYIETLEDWTEKRQAGAPGFAGETDRIYLDVPQRLEIEDPVWQRRLVLETEGSRSAIVWNPWIDKARRLSQFAADAWQRMLCIETANVWEDCILLAPDARHRLSLKLWSEAL